MSNEQIDQIPYWMELQEWKFADYYLNLRAKARELDLEDIDSSSDNIVIRVFEAIGRDRMEEIPGFSEIGLHRAFLLDLYRIFHQSPPKELFSIRRIWYKVFKQFTQQFWNRDAKERKTDYSKKLSVALQSIVSSGIIDYRDFFVEDVSRMITFQEQYGWKNIVLFGEKDAFTPLITKTAQILGIKAVYSGKGKSAFAGSEKTFRAIKDELDPDKPLVLLVLSDWDADGVNGVQSGTVNQFQHYCKKYELEFKWKRVGIYPDQVEVERHTPRDALFLLPPSRQNGKWAQEHAIPYTDSETGETRNYGIELEAIDGSEFHEPILEACLEIFSVADMSEWARKRFTPSEWDYDYTREELIEELLQDHCDALEINARLKRIEELKDQVEAELNPIRAQIDEYLKEKQAELLALPNWDSRQRKWDEDAEEWTKESLEATYEEHERKIRLSIDIQRPFNNGWSALSFQVSQLQDKLHDELKEAYEEDNEGDICDSDDFDDSDIPKLCWCKEEDLEEDKEFQEEVATEQEDFEREEECPEELEKMALESLEMQSEISALQNQVEGLQEVLSEKKADNQELQEEIEALQQEKQEEPCKQELLESKNTIANLLDHTKWQKNKIEELEAKADKTPKGITPPLDQSLQDQIYQRAQELKAQDCKRIYATLQKEFPQVKSLATLHKYAKGNNNQSE